MTAPRDFAPYVDFSKPYANRDLFWSSWCWDYAKMLELPGRCHVCGVQLAPDAIQNKFCSNRCLEEEAKPHLLSVHICKDCGAMLEKPARGPHPERCFDCRLKADAAVKRARRQATYEDKVCPACGRALERTGDLGRPREYCDLICKRVAAIDRQLGQLQAERAALLAAKSEARP